MDSEIAALQREKASRRGTTGSGGADAAMRAMNPLGGGPPAARRPRGPASPTIPGGPPRDAKKPVSGGLLSEMRAKLEGGSTKAEESDGPGKLSNTLQHPGKQEEAVKEEETEKEPGDFSRW